MPRRLIIGYDGSEHGEDALALGVVLAECLAATPLIATVIPQHAHLPSSERLEDAADADARPILDAAAKRLGRANPELSQQLRP